MSKEKSQTSTGGREATTAVIPGRFALSVGKPDIPTPKGWQWVKLTDVARLESGHTPSRQRPEYWDGGISWVGIKDATSNHGRVIGDTYQHCSQLGIDNSSARVLPANTVCLSRTASVGYVVVMGKPMATSQDFVNWVCSDAIDYRYLASILVAERDSLFQFSRGTTHQTIYYPEVKAFHVCLPPIDQQKRIADIIWSMNDKIELNRQINQTLEQIAQTIFKSWFVDFEPVKAKIEAKAAGRDPERAAMCAISGKLEPELDQLPPDQYQQLAATAALFPDELVESELGLIPVGWGGKRIKDVIKRFSVGKKYSQKTASATGLVPILDQGKSGVIGFHNNQPGVEASPDDPIIVFANHTCYMRLIMHDFSAIQNVLPFKGVDLNIFWLYAATIGKQEFIEYKGHWPDFEIKEIAIPPGKLSQSYGAYVNEIYREIFANDCQSATLVELRDTLLPKLLSGEIELNQAV